MGPGQPVTQGSTGMIQNSVLTGATVLDSQNQKLGQIKDVLFDVTTGQATFVVLDAGIPGVTNRAMLVVPYQALQMNVSPSDNHLTVMLNRKPDQLRAAPQIQNNQWQLLQNSQFLTQARDFYQIKAYYAARPIDNAVMPNPPAQISPPPPPAASPAYPTFLVVPPCVTNGSNFSQSLEDFYNE
jgi:sporulation protein YlmC with PRC-barrel domain